jgi:hypothetical protein
MTTSSHLCVVIAGTGHRRAQIRDHYALVRIMTINVQWFEPTAQYVCWSGQAEGMQLRTPVSQRYPRVFLPASDTQLHDSRRKETWGQTSQARSSGGSSVLCLPVHVHGTNHLPTFSQEEIRERGRQATVR